MEEKDIRQYHFFQALADLPFVDAIYLYGSRARGDNDLRSDYDLAIECPKASQSDWLTVLDIIDQADTLFKIDCIRLDEVKDNQFLENIHKYKQCLYMRG